ncbi:hypothetical protein BDW69DRAFT_167129 [Aspergillus filifer]
MSLFSFYLSSLYLPFSFPILLRVHFLKTSIPLWYQAIKLSSLKSQSKDTSSSSILGPDIRCCLALYS